MSNLGKVLGEIDNLLDQIDNSPYEYQKERATQELVALLRKVDLWSLTSLEET